MSLIISWNVRKICYGCYVFILYQNVCPMVFESVCLRVAPGIVVVFYPHPEIICPDDLCYYGYSSLLKCLNTRAYLKVLNLWVLNRKNDAFTYEFLYHFNLLFAENTAFEKYVKQNSPTGRWYEEDVQGQNI